MDPITRWSTLAPDAGMRRSCSTDHPTWLSGASSWAVVRSPSAPRRQLATGVDSSGSMGPRTSARGTSTTAEASWVLSSDRWRSAAEAPADRSPGSGRDQRHSSSLMG
ncbi:MAG TPA: hypothetical protein VK988_08825 [Acidimicrobiales bacterium]|nr:hypothetical protein [Acidimicrobiales bacterium]